MSVWVFEQWIGGVWWDDGVEKPRSETCVGVGTSLSLHENLEKTFASSEKLFSSKLDGWGNLGSRCWREQQTILIISSISVSVGRTQNSYIETLKLYALVTYIHTYILKKCLERRYQKFSLHLQITQIWTLSFRSSWHCQVFVARFSSSFGARRLFDEDLSRGLCQHLSHLVRLSPSSPSHASCWHAHASPLVWCPTADAAYRVLK